MRLNCAFERVTSAVSAKVKAACCAPQHFQVQKINILLVLPSFWGYIDSEEINGQFSV